MEDIASNNQVSSSSTIILMAPDATPPISVRSSIEKHSVHNHLEYPDIPTRKKRPAKEVSLAGLRDRLCTTQFLYRRLTLVSNMMCLLAIVGIVLMVIENELIFHNNNQDTKATWFIKLIITITTVILLALIFYYHCLDIKLYSCRNAFEDWHLGLTAKRILMIAAEVMICAVHPMPRSYPRFDTESINLNLTTSQSPAYTVTDVGLGLPMFLRLYLLGRSIVLHSDLVHNVALRSFGSMNNVSFDVVFIMKTYLERWPIRCLFVFFTILFFVGSWALRACENLSVDHDFSIANAMWLFIETFTTIGYGDFYPITYCGRSIATIIGFIGLLLSALLIALITQKLLLTREEKYIHTFVLNTKLAQQYKAEAANVIKFALKSWYLKRKHKSTSFHCFQARQKLYQSIYCLKRIKQTQRNLIGNCINFIELMTAESNTSSQTEQAVEQIMTIQSAVKNLEENLNNRMESLQNTLNVLSEKLTK